MPLQRLPQVALGVRTVERRLAVVRRGPRPGHVGALGETSELVQPLLRDVVLATGHLWLAYSPTQSGYAVAVLPGLLLVATGVALSFTPTTMVITSATPETHTGLASGLAGSATQIGAALGTATFTAIALSSVGHASAAVDATGFRPAFTAAALVAISTAMLGTLLRRPRTEQ